MTRTVILRLAILAAFSVAALAIVAISSLVPAPRQPATFAATAASPLTKSVLQYRRTLPDVFDGMANLLDRGTLDKASAVAYAKGHGKAMALEIDRAYDTHSDEHGTVTSPKALAKELRDTARALRSP